MGPQGDNTISKIKTRGDFIGQTTWFIQQQKLNVQEKKKTNKQKKESGNLESKRDLRDLGPDSNKLKILNTNLKVEIMELVLIVQA